MINQIINVVAKLISSASAIFIGAGAGIGIDSGLPDFRGSKGLWKSIPQFNLDSYEFTRLATPRLFLSDPTLAWGFYGYRLSLYNNTNPHTGYDILHKWASNMSGGYFVYTSNVDGHFQKAGFNKNNILEIHGSIHSLQCSENCGYGIYQQNLDITIDNNMRAIGNLPQCPGCGCIARPNIMMFNDSYYDNSNLINQLKTYKKFIDKLPQEKIVILEIGAGTSIPSVRKQTEYLADKLRTRLIRINPHEDTISPGDLSVPLGASEALRLIDEKVGEMAEWSNAPVY
jgi:NAD-dependent SIR2 family protein deacetylase